MQIKAIKILTWIFFLTLSLESFKVYSAVLKQEHFDTHMRWSIQTDKDQLAVQKSGKTLYIKTLNIKLWDKFLADLNKVEKDNKYIRSVDKDLALSGGRSLKISLSSSDIEVFNFYRDRDNSYVIDFWSDVSAKENKQKSIVKASKRSKGSKRSKVNSAKKKKSVVSVPLVNDRVQHNMKYRDFRYGAPFIWDYKTATPGIKHGVNFKNKTPEFYYPIKDRDVNKGIAETHIQLTINLYRKKQWGLMNKSIKLFKTKYGKIYNKYLDIFEYLKANAILRENMGSPKNGPVKMALAMFANIVDRTKDYELKKGILKYSISFHIDQKDHIHALGEAKRLYVYSRENFDIEESVDALGVIMYNLALLKQTDKIKELLNDKMVRKSLAPLQILAYRIYAFLELGHPEEVVKLYEANKEVIKGEDDSTIIYNVAEAYFRIAKYRKALKTYDYYLTHWSENSLSSYARVRLALTYELLAEDSGKIEKLYLNAINMSSLHDASYEAKIRYVAFRCVRKIKTNDSDREIRVFLKNENIGKESKDLKKLLWIVRLRTFIVDKKYFAALEYLSVIPIAAMKPSNVRVFDGDGAEIVYGLIKDNYSKSQYSSVVKNWIKYKDKYLSKIALDPLLNFAVSKSYIELGLMDSFDRHIRAMNSYEKAPVKTYPIWIKRERYDNGEFKNVFAELRIIRALKGSKYKKVKRLVNEWHLDDRSKAFKHYYHGLIAYRTGAYDEAVRHFERLLSTNDSDKLVDQKAVGDMLRAYTDSLYRTNQLEKYVAVGVALIKDVSFYKEKTDYVFSIEERIAYNIIEILNSNEGLQKKYVFANLIDSFLMNYKNSIHAGRARLLLGSHYLKLKREREGKIILESLLKDKDVSDPVKDLARSELSLLKIRKRII